MEGPTKRLILVMLVLVVGGQLLLWSMQRYDPVEDALSRARGRIAQGDFTSAIDILRHLAALYPQRADAWAALADIDAYVGGETCAAEAQAAVAKAVACPDAPAHLAFAHRVQGMILLLEGEAGPGEQALGSAAGSGDALAARTLALLALHAGRPDAAARLGLAADGMPGDDALAAALASIDATHASEQARADPPADADRGWVLLEHARLDVALGQDQRAADLLRRARHGQGVGHLEDQVPLDRADLLRDGMFAHAGRAAALEIARWPEAAPWSGFAPAPPAPRR